MSTINFVNLTGILQIKIDKVEFGIACNSNANIAWLLKMQALF